MTQELIILSATAASIALLHTILGPDHYIPFIMMARARGWRLLKTTWITLLCGIGHVGSSIVLGLIGIFFGISVNKLKLVESIRGNLAAWMLIIFGLGYLIWGVIRIIQNKPHKHLHVHPNGKLHSHKHIHAAEHLHTHEERENITPWILFTIFVLGPCEPLIPILMYPAANKSMPGLILVTTIFSLVTIATMMTIVIVTTLGFNLIPFVKLEKYTHAIAGGMILLCGIGIVFLGL